MTNIKRAYTEEDKQLREQKIIDAAQQLLMERGYLNINMNDVAQTAGLAKGTVYLYFKTKEELFLSVVELQVSNWIEGIHLALVEISKPSSNEAIARLLVTSVADRPLLTRLLAISPLVLEYNVSYERAASHKRFLVEQMNIISHLLEESLGLKPGEGAFLLLRFSILIGGLEGIAHPSPISKLAMEQEMPVLLVDFEEELYALLMLVLP